VSLNDATPPMARRRRGPKPGTTRQTDRKCRSIALCYRPLSVSAQSAAGRCGGSNKEALLGLVKGSATSGEISWHGSPHLKRAWMRAADATPGRGACWIPRIAHAPLPKTVQKWPIKRVAFLWKALLQKTFFWCWERFRWLRAHICSSETRY
jgi:hypothetical protein